MSPRSCVNKVISCQELSRAEHSRRPNWPPLRVAQRIRFNESYGEQNLKLIENMDTQVLKDQKDRKSTTNHTLKRQKSPKTY